MAEFLKVAEVAEVPPGTVKYVVLLSKHIALCNVAGEFYAIDNVCVHRGAPLSEGWLDGCIIECPKGKIDVNDDRLLLTSKDGNRKTWYRHDLKDNVDFWLGETEY